MKSAVKELIDILEDNDLNAVSNAVRELGKSKDKAAVKPLITLLKKCISDYNRRFLTVEILEALGNLRAEEAEPLLRKAMENPTFYIQGAAATALGKIEPESKSVRNLTELMAQDVPLSTRLKAIEGLRESNEEEAVTPLIDIYYEEANKEIRRSILRALGNIATPGAIGFLKQEAKTGKPDTRADALLGLAETGRKDLELFVKGFLTDPDILVRKNAAMTLGMLKFLENPVEN